MRMTRPPSPLAVSLLAVPETSAAVLYGLHEVLAYVGSAWEELTGTAAPGRRVTPTVVAATRAPFTSTLGVPIAPGAALDEATPCEVVIVPDLALAMDVDPRGRWRGEAAWLRDRYRAGAIVCSVCTGSVLLAEAGLLDGVEATTHWAARGIFERCYPSVHLRPQRILLPAGPEHRIITSGGSAAWAELALYLIGRLCGREEALRTAKVFLFGDRSDGQLPFAVMARPRPHTDAVIEACQTWIAEHHAKRNPAAGMVRHSGLAPRTFKRRFRTATGYAPIEYVQALRVEEAKQLLEATDIPVESVASMVGYEDPAAFRRVFKRMTAVTPARYRRRLRGLGNPDQRASVHAESAVRSSTP